MRRTYSPDDNSINLLAFIFISFIDNDNGSVIPTPRFSIDLGSNYVRG